MADGNKEDKWHKPACYDFKMFILWLPSAAAHPFSDES